MTELHKALSRYFGLHSFKKGQEEIMTSVLQKKDTIAMLPTGGENHYAISSRVT